MPNLTCFRLRDSHEEGAAPTFDDFIATDHPISTVGPTAFVGFEAKLFVSAVPAHAPNWLSFLVEAFPQADVPFLSSVSAVLIVAVTGDTGRRWFAFTFGPAARFLLSPQGYRRGFGLRAALNILSPEEASPARVRTVDARRRAAEVTRSRVQTNAGAAIGAFGIDQWRDLVTRADGVPSDSERWGTRVAGGDAVHLSRSIKFGDLGELCQQLDAVHAADRYRREFAWIDHYQPVLDEDLRMVVEERILQKLRNRDFTGIELGAPEIIDWADVSGFHFHFDKPKVYHDPLRIEDLVNGLDGRDELVGVTREFLQARRITMIDGEGHRHYSWPIWNCLLGEFEVDGETFVVEEGQLFRVDADYLSQVDAWLDNDEELPHVTDALPTGKRGEEEKKYNARAAIPGERLLLDRRNVHLPGETSIELCDLLTREGTLIHVKRRGSARELSHLFAQGAVSALALNSLPALRVAAQAEVDAVAGDASFPLFSEAPFDPRDLQVAFILIDDVKGRDRRSALPFFSRLNLRRSAQEIKDRGYRLAYCRIEAED